MPIFEVQKTRTVCRNPILARKQAVGGLDLCANRPRKDARTAFLEEEEEEGFYIFVVATRWPE